MAAPRTAEQPFTYDGLVNEVTTLLLATDYEGVANLITSENIRILERCNPSVIGTEDQTNTVALTELVTRWTWLTGEIAKKADALGVLPLFTSTNALAVQFWNQSQTEGNREELIDYLTAEALAKNLPECS